MTLANAQGIYSNQYSDDDPNAPSFADWLAASNITIDPDDTAPVAPPADPTAAMTQAQYLAYLAAQNPAWWDWYTAYAAYYTPEAIAARQAAADAQLAADRAYAFSALAQQPPEIRAMYDLGGEGYGSAYTIVAQANPTAPANDIFAQATALQIAADTAGVLPSAVIAQNPDAAAVNTTIDPTTITTTAGPGAGTGAPSSGKKNSLAIVAALVFGAWALSKRAA